MANKEILNYDPATKSLSPDHIVYAKAKQLAVCEKCNLAEAFASFEKENGYKPKIIFFTGNNQFVDTILININQGILCREMERRHTVPPVGAIAFTIQISLIDTIGINIARHIRAVLLQIRQKFG